MHILKPITGQMGRRHTFIRARVYGSALKYHLVLQSRIIETTVETKSTVYWMRT